ncbi:MAG: 1,4-alpha-glucan branching protein GlgB [Clostridiales bacterium]|nr:1,4-alpha-glucan branching protein GlgB [Clostridiales bacterium]
MNKQVNKINNNLKMETIKQNLNDSSNINGNKNTESKIKETRKKTCKSKDDLKVKINSFHNGTNYEAYKFMGAHKVTENNVEGIRFTTWAPHAKAIYVSGDFNLFKVENKYKLKKISKNGLWSIFIKDIKPGTKYKFVVEDKNNKLTYKSDPFAFESEVRPNNASIISEEKRFKWEDTSFITRRKRKNIYNNPMNIYEVHLGSWKTKDNKFMTYEEISEILPDYVEKMGYTHVEIMPLVEHPLDASWGYQGTGYYSVTSRYGTKEGFKKLVNEFHKKNISVILDWVPGHFCRDEHGLYMFDGTPTYEYQERWRADNSGWGTSNFDLGKAEVKSFLISNALYWINEFHIDGLRVDAVSNILYLDYDRGYGQWKPNKYGGNENYEGIDFIKTLNKVISEKCKNIMMIAEESTAWPNVCREEGLGFNFKWNMGWMNDVLEYIKIDPLFRKGHHGKLTFAMMYNYAENYILPISHDEVVHGKKSLLNKMFGDEWNRFAGVRTFLAYMMSHPGKKLTFMGNELGVPIEWREYEELEWNLVEEFDMNKKLQNYVKDLNLLYKENKAFWELDYAPEGFEWIDADNKNQSILAFMRKGKKEEDTLIFVINFTPVVYFDFDIGVPYLKDYVEIFNSDDKKYGGSGQIIGDEKLVAKDKKKHNQNYSLTIKVPPMGTLVLALDKRRKK